MKNRIKNAFAILIVLCNVSCDQVSKSIVRDRIDYYETISVIGNYFTLTKIENSGAFLSLGHNLPSVIKLLLLSALPVLVIIFGLYVVLTNKTLPRQTAVGICFVIGGGIGNLYDRIIHGSVTDFMYLDFGIFHTGIFNLADVSIMIGFGLILLQSLTRKIQPAAV